MTNSIESNQPAIGWETFHMENVDGESKRCSSTQGTWSFDFKVIDKSPDFKFEKPSDAKAPYTNYEVTQTFEVPEDAKLIFNAQK